MADTVLGNLIWRITGDTRDFDSKVAATDKRATGLAGSFAKVGAGIAGAFAGYAVIQKTIGFLKDSAKAATDAGEVYSKFGVVFDDVSAKADAAAKSYADAFDLADVSAQKLLSNTGNILQGFGATADQSLQMSVAINTLAADLASFTNIEGGAERASHALTQAMTGEREMAKALGIVIREEDIQARLAAQGKAKLTGNALNLAKAQITLQIATEQAKNAIGDYARTQDSTANTIKRAQESTLALKVALGEALNPATTLAADLWGKVASAMADVIRRQNELRNAEKAQRGGSADIDQRILLLQKEEKEVRASLNSYKVYDEQGRLIRSQSLDDAEKELAAIVARRKGLEIQRDMMKQSLAQQQAAKETVSKYNADIAKSESEADKASRERIEAALKLLEEYNAELDRISWQNKNNIISDKEATQQTYDAQVQLATALHDMGVETGKLGPTAKSAYDEALAGIKKYQDALKDKGPAKTFMENMNEALSFAANLTSAIGDLISNLYQRQIDQLDAKMQKEMEAAGVAESTAVQTAELELAKAKEVGDEETIIEAEKALKKAQIEEKYEKKKADLEYKAALASWRVSLLTAQVAAAQAILNGYKTQPFIPAGLLAGTMAAGLATVQTAAIMAAKPVRTYAEGGSFIVPEGYNGDSFPLAMGMAQSGERVTIETPQQQAAADQPQTIIVPVNLDGKEVARVVTRYQRNRQV